VGLAKADLIAQKLKEILPSEHIIPYATWPEGWQQKLKGTVKDEIQSPWMAVPDTLDKLSATMASIHGDRAQVLLAGQGTKLGWGALSGQVDVLLSTRNLNRLVDHAVGDMTVTLEAGMRFTDLQSHLAKHQQWIPLDPAYPEQATVGGMLATRDAGSLRHRYGGMRDLCLGVTVVRSDGQVAKAGGRVVKNVAGYDLMKLFTGSFGTLGIVAEMTLRAYPLPECSGTVLVRGEDRAIADLTQSLLQSTLTPTSVDIFMGLEPLTLAVRFQSLAESVSAQMEQLCAMAKLLALSVETLAVSEDTAWWTQSATQILENSDPASVLCQIGVLSALAVPSLIQMQQAAAKRSVQIKGRIHVGSGLGQLRLTGSEPDCLGVVGELRSQCQQANGYLSVLEAPVFLKQSLDIWGYSGNALVAMRKLKERFDPQGLLNTGRFVGGI
jgi:glycolate oxidase FAD binding subunit